VRSSPARHRLLRRMQFPFPAISARIKGAHWSGRVEPCVGRGIAFPFANSWRRDVGIRRDIHGNKRLTARSWRSPRQRPCCWWASTARSSAGRVLGREADAAARHGQRSARDARRADPRVHRHIAGCERNAAAAKRKAMLAAVVLLQHDFVQHVRGRLHERPQYPQA